MVEDYTLWKWLEEIKREIKAAFLWEFPHGNK